MKIIAVIPARYEASRFPGKLMQLLGDKTVIATTYQNVVETRLFDEVFVAVVEAGDFGVGGVALVLPTEFKLVGFFRFQIEIGHVVILNHAV